MSGKRRNLTIQAQGWREKWIKKLIEYRQILVGLLLLYFFVVSVLKNKIL